VERSDEATKFASPLACFAKPVLGRAHSRDRWLAMMQWLNLRLATM
jgi:hypothetical protein